MNVCTKCGIQFEDGVQFCQNCGTKRRRSVVKKNMSGGAKVGITLLALFVIAIIGLYLYGCVVLYAGGTSRPNNYDFTREGRKLAEIVTADDASVMITRECNASIFIYKRKSILRE